MIALCLFLSIPAAAQVTVGVDLDLNLGQADYGDRRGDLKSLNYTIKSGKSSFGLDAGVDTPQRSDLFTQTDTAYISGYIGREFGDLTLYGGADFYNGPIHDTWQEIVKGLHDLTGRDTVERDASTGFVLNPAIKARYDYRQRLTDRLGLTLVGFGKGSTRDSFVGAGGYLIFGDTKPNIYGLPKSVNTGTSFYAGVEYRHVFDDVRVQDLHEKQVSLNAGLSFRVNDSTTVGVLYYKPLTDEVTIPNMGYKPVDKFGVTLTFGY